MTTFSELESNFYHVFVEMYTFDFFHLVRSSFVKDTYFRFFSIVQKIDFVYFKNYCSIL